MRKPKRPKRKSARDVAIISAVAVLSFLAGYLVSGERVVYTKENVYIPVEKPVYIENRVEVPVPAYVAFDEYVLENPMTKEPIYSDNYDDMTKRLLGFTLKNHTPEDSDVRLVFQFAGVGYVHYTYSGRCVDGVWENIPVRVEDSGWLPIDLGYASYPGLIPLDDTPHIGPGEEITVRFKEPFDPGIWPSDWRECYAIGLLLYYENNRLLSPPLVVLLDCANELYWPSTSNILSSVTPDGGWVE